MLLRQRSCYQDAHVFEWRPPSTSAYFPLGSGDGIVYVFSDSDGVVCLKKRKGNQRRNTEHRDIHNETYVVIS